MGVLEHLIPNDWETARRNFERLERVFSLASKDSDGFGFTVAGIGVRFGTNTVTWAGGTPTSGNRTVTHGLGRTPVVAFVTPKIGAWANWLCWTGAVGSTTFLVAAWSTSGNPPAATSDTFSWLVIG